MRIWMNWPLAYSVFINIILILIIAASFLKKKRLFLVSFSLAVLIGLFLAPLGVPWRAIMLGSLACAMIPLLFMKINRTFMRYKAAVEREHSIDEARHKELLTEEGFVYDAQLKHNEKLSRISSLYEITKDMSTTLRFSEVFKILTEYLQKAFLFRRARLILTRADDEDGVSGNIVYESRGTLDDTLKAKGILPKLEISKQPFDNHDRKIYNLLKKDIKRLQITKGRWEENPYAEFLPDGAETYMAIPMVVDKQLIGILTIDALPTSDFEKFSILAAQFVLEMRRIVLYEKVEELAITDGLTKAFAKRHIMERLGEEFERSKRHGFYLSFLMIDIDYFKNYNDTYGHLVGDVVLKDIVSLLKGHTREVDLVGRFGGEEFCAILPETGKEEARLVAERIREVIATHKFRAYDELTNVTVSIGLATYPDDADSMSDLVENSDKSLYIAKNSGRNRVITHQP